MSAVWQVPELKAIARGTLVFSPAEENRIRSRFFAAVAKGEKDSSRSVTSGK